MINLKILKEIKEYCKLNDIDDIEAEINKMLRIGFNYEKYGNSVFYENKIQQDNKQDVSNKTEMPLQEDKPKKRIRIINN